MIGLFGSYVTLGRDSNNELYKCCLLFVSIGTHIHTIPVVRVLHWLVPSTSNGLGYKHGGSSSNAKLFAPCNQQSDLLRCRLYTHLLQVIFAPLMDTPNSKLCSLACNGGTTFNLAPTAKLDHQFWPPFESALRRTSISQQYQATSLISTSATL